MASIWILFFSYQDDARSNTHQKRTPESTHIGHAVLTPTLEVEEVYFSDSWQFLIPDNSVLLLFYRFIFPHMDSDKRCTYFPVGRRVIFISSDPCTEGQISKVFDWRLLIALSKFLQERTWSGAFSDWNIRHSTCVIRSYSLSTYLTNFSCTKKVNTIDTQFPSYMFRHFRGAIISRILLRS